MLNSCLNVKEQRKIIFMKKVSIILNDDVIRKLQEYYQS